MSAQAIDPEATLAVLLILGCLSACGSGDRRDYNYYKDHPDEAKSVSDQCKINGTMGMAAQQVAQCNAARNAAASRKAQ